MTRTRTIVTAIIVGAALLGAGASASAAPVDGHVPGACIDNATTGPAPYSDVSGGAFYAAGVDWAHANRITIGVTPTRFAPDVRVSRGEFATMLHRMACHPVPRGSAGFVDLVPGAFYSTAIDWLVGEGITIGKTPTTFGPDDPMTRGEFAAFLHRFVGSPGSSPVAPFGDVDRSLFFAAPIDWLVHRSVTIGTTATTFSPWSHITRGEVVTFLHRLESIADVGLRLRPVATGLAAPIAGTTEPTTGAVLIAERGGRVIRFAAGAGGPDWSTGTTVLDLAGTIGAAGEGGLLGIAVAPDGTALFVSYTDTAGDSVIRRYPYAGGSVTGPPVTVITQDQPQANHNGGNVVFGPDDRLYTSFGDGGGSNDSGNGHPPGGNGQDLSTRLGAILRLDPLAGGGYSTAGNPFVGTAGAAPEIWANGVRNPWRFSFDSHTGDLWVADVGQGAREEITRLRAADGGGRGANLGWRLREGEIATPGVGGPAPLSHVGPVHTYAHPASGCVSITGGNVYRGADIPALWGTYLYGDYCLDDRLRGWRDVAGVEAETFAVSVPGGSLVSFLEDAEGEFYTISIDGTISRLERTLN